MPTGIYKRKPRSEETRKRMSESKLGNKNPMFGREVSEETRKKLSKANSGTNNGFYGKKHLKEARDKISKANKGRRAWNKGLTKDTDERVMKNSGLTIK